MFSMRPRLVCFILAVGTLVSGLAYAVVQTPQAGSRAETFRLDPVHCMAMFRIHHQGAGQFWGRFNEVTGMVDYPRDDSSAPVFDVIVNVGSIDTGTTKLDRTLIGPDFFNGREFETIAFKSSTAERVSERKWKVDGELTLLGKTAPVSAMVEVTGVRGNPVVAKAGWEAIFTIKRSDFGMNWGVENGSLGDEVRLVIGLEGESGPPAKK